MTDFKNLCSFGVEELTQLGASHAIATGSTSKQQQVKFANSKIVRTSIDESTSIELFAAVDGRTAMTDVKKMDEESVKASCGELLKLAKKLPVNKDFVDTARGTFKYNPITFDKRTAEMGLEAVDLVERAMETAGAVKSAGMFELDVSENFLHSSTGPHGSQKSTGAYFSIRCLEDKAASGHKVTASSRVGEIKFEELAKEASSLARKARNPSPGPQGVYNIVFDALPFAALINNVADSAGAFNVESGLSCLTGKVGQKIAAGDFSLFDDACNSSGLHSTAFDAEGTATKRTAIIQNGVLKTFLHNTSTATRHKAKSTGNAGILSPHAWNLEVEKGKATLDELLREAKNGIYISNIWYTRFQNYATGDFSTIPRDAAFLIENGELTKPINRIRITSSLPHLLANASLLSSNSRQIYGWEVETPTVSPDALVEKMHVSIPQG